MIHISWEHMNATAFRSDPSVKTIHLYEKLQFLIWLKHFIKIVMFDKPDGQDGFEK
jgi:hypothetical protein